MASLVLAGDTSGSITVAAPAVAGSNTQTLVATTGTLAPIVSGTAVASTSGTSIDFTGIPSWVKRITVMLSGVSTNGTSNVQIQIGSGSFTTSGYVGGNGNAVLSGTSGGANYTTGLPITSTAAATVFHGAVVLALINSATNAWVSFSSIGFSNVAAGGGGGGSITLSGVLDRVRITTVNGTDTFDAGTINIIYE